MIVFPNAKINLGLNIVGKRPDGYHDLDMVMVPVDWRDVLEVVPSQSGNTTLTVTGRTIDCPMEKNLVYKAWSLLNEAVDGNLQAVDIYLHKNIPDGAGLGGGSSDAAFMLKALNELFALDFSDEKLAEFASRLGADCPFFIYNRPMHCTGIGTVMREINIDFSSACHVVIAKLIGVGVSTAEAYSNVTPSVQRRSTAEIVKDVTLAQWQGLLINDFEKNIFILKPEIGRIKQQFLQDGAVYSSMSGSGSAVYGLFKDELSARRAAAHFSGCAVFAGRL